MGFNLTLLIYDLRQFCVKKLLFLECSLIVRSFKYTIHKCPSCGLLKISLVGKLSTNIISYVPLLLVGLYLCIRCCGLKDLFIIPLILY